MGCGNDSLFGGTSQFIKTNAGDLIAVLGSNTIERQMLADLRIPYKQILHSRVILKAGQINYLLNFLGMGDNATFLSMKATYDPKSVNEESNYINWSFFDSLSTVNHMDQLMILTGNSTNRIKQLYLTNPNSTYPVIIDVLVASIDDTYSYFQDTVNQTGTMFTGLSYTNIETYVVDESIVIFDSNSPRNALMYIVLTNINSITRTSTMLVIEDVSAGMIYLTFLTEWDAMQAQSALNYVLQNSGAILPMTSDLVPPVVYLLNQVGASSSGATLSIIGTGATGPYNTSWFGYTYSSTISTSILATFGATISLADFGDSGTITLPRLNSLLVGSASDNRDGDLTLSDSNFVLTNYAGNSVVSIIATGTYSLKFVLKDIAGNEINSLTKIELYII